LALEAEIDSIRNAKKKSERQKEMAIRMLLARRLGEQQSFRSAK